MAQSYKQAPKSCPKCAHTTIQLTVIAWAQFDVGAFDYLDVHEDFQFMSGALAHCVDCAYQWYPEEHTT